MNGVCITLQNTVDRKSIPSIPGSAIWVWLGATCEVQDPDSQHMDTYMLLDYPCSQHTVTCVDSSQHRGIAEEACFWK